MSNGFFNVAALFLSKDKDDVLSLAKKIDEQVELVYENGDSFAILFSGTRLSCYDLKIKFSKFDCALRDIFCSTQEDGDEWDGESDVCQTNDNAVCDDLFDFMLDHGLEYFD